MDGRDIPNSSLSSHRLPTLSAAEALQGLTSACNKPISTGLRSLDAILEGKESDQASQDDTTGGFARGQVAEIWGPAGVGKTAFAMQVAAKALHAGISVVWIDGSYELATSRLQDILSGSPSPDSERDPEPSQTRKVQDDLLTDFHHFATPTLSHLLVLLAHSSDSFPPEGTGLMIIDCISSLFAAAFPKVNEVFDNKQTPEKKKSDLTQWAAGRRWAVLGDVVSTLSKLAAMRNMAVLLTSQAIIKITAETGAMLHPSLASSSWDSGIPTRIVLFRDWAFKSSHGPPPSHQVYVPGVRFAGVPKAAAVSHLGAGKIVPFTIEKHGLQSIDIETRGFMTNRSGEISTSLKRKSELISGSPAEDGETGSDEEFGWADDEPFNIHALG